MLREYGEKVSGDVRGNIESALNNLREALKSDDADRIRKSLDNLNQASSKLGEEMYKAQAAPGGAGAGARGPEASTDRGTTGGGKKDEDVIDAEYEVKE